MLADRRADGLAADVGGRHNPKARNIGPDLLREGIERADFGVFLASLPPQGAAIAACATFWVVRWDRSPTPVRSSWP